MNQLISNPYQKSVQEIAQQVETNLQNGLTNEEATNRRNDNRRYRNNVIWDILFASITSDEQQLSILHLNFSAIVACFQFDKRKSTFLLE